MNWLGGALFGNIFELNPSVVAVTLGTSWSEIAAQCINLVDQRLTEKTRGDYPFPCIKLRHSSRQRVTQKII